MQCEQIQSELIAYLHGTLSPQERAAIEAHLMQCEACSEEANAMRDISDKLSRGLKEWVNEGVCPPDVAERIQRSLRGESRRFTRRRAAAAITAVAAAAAVLLFALSTQPQFAQQVASVPFLGALAAHLLEPDLEIHLDPQQRMTAALFRPQRSVKLNVTAEAEGLKLTVTAAALSDQSLRIAYTLRGEGLTLPEDEKALMPTASTESGPLTCRSLTAEQGRGAIHFQLYCDAAPAGEAISLTVPPLPREQGGTFPSLTATFSY